MRRQISPSKLLVPPGPQAFPQRHCLGEQTVIVNHYAGIEKAIPSLPGFRTSAAFLTSLSANLRIDPDCPSPLGTPTTFRHNSYSLHPLPPTSLTFSTLPAPHNPYPSPAETEILSSPEPIAPAKSATNPPPQLSTYTAESQDDRAQGLRLVASSVAEQRHIASKMLLLHPITLTAFTLTSILVLQYTLTAYPTNWPLAAGTLLALLTLSLLAIRRATSPYLTLAHDIDTTWLTSDRLLVVKWGADVIGALVLGWADSDAAKKRGRRRRGKAVIRSWTVAPKYRGKGVGKSLLEEAVRVAGEKGADGILFHGEHANSKRILPTPFNRFLDALEARAEKALTKVADEKGNFRQRQGSPTWGSR